MKNIFIFTGLLATGTAEAAKGRLGLETDKPDGTNCSATVEVRKAGQTAVVKTFSTPGGLGQVDLDPGQYDVKATAVNGYWGTLRVTIESGAVHNKRLELPNAPAGGSSGSGSSGGGAVEKTISGRVTNPGTTLKPEGKVVLLKEVDDATLTGGKFTLKGVALGKYRVAVYSKTGKLLVIKEMTVGATTTEASITLE